MNLYGHATLGPIVERMYGSARFLVLYLLSALGGGVAAVWLSPDGLTAGSSGALCGLIGGFGAFVVLNRRHLGGDLYDASRRWLGNTIVLLVMFSLLPNVSWQGHLGGAVAGVVAGVLLTYHRFGTPEQRWAALLGLVLLPLAGVAPLVEKRIIRLRPAAAGRAVRLRTADRPGRRTGPGPGDGGVRRPGRPAPRPTAGASRQGDGRSRPGRTGRTRPRTDGRPGTSRPGRPYHAAVLEQARAAALQYVADRILVTKALDVCLARGGDWAVANGTAGPGRNHTRRTPQSGAGGRTAVAAVRPGGRGKSLTALPAQSDSPKPAAGRTDRPRRPLTAEPSRATW